MSQETNNQTSRLDLHATDLGTAASILTRVPLASNWVNPARMAQAVWAYPIIGALVGLLGGLALNALIWIGFLAGVSAAVALGVVILLTGAMHEDGLADTADGLGGGTDKASALEIMKDSRVGAYGVIALLLFTIARWSALEQLAGQAAIASMIVAGTLSRGTVSVVMAAMANARDGGLSSYVGRPAAQHGIVAFAISFTIALAFCGWWGLLVAPVALLGSLPLVFLASKKLGGQTGDVLGAIQVCVEVVVLGVLTAIWV